jgi:protein-tyrosine-phosphatase/DNA-binding HxlR family transcriptional regulator
MISERIVQEARLHAALGDPHRLVIAEALADGDASPNRLGQELGMASNLMAHHVSVLVDAGVIVRSRSEADRRRVYLTLTPRGRTILSPRLATPHRVLFVCTHNSARSQFAEALWRSRSHVPAGSAGTHPARRVHPMARRVARHRGLDLQKAPQAFALDDVGDSLIVTVCDHSDEELVGVTHVHWSVPDPAASGEVADFEAAFDRISERIDHLALTAADSA